MDVAPAAPVLKQATRVSYAEVEGFSGLFRDYTAAHPDVAPFYRLGFEARDLATASNDAAGANHADRDTVVEVLRRQQRLWGDDAAADRNVEKLLDPEAAVIITGQQVGLFTGPTYTVLKAMTTVLVARKLEAETGRPVVPVFWLGSEDHDLAEMASTWVPGRPDPVRLHYDAGIDPETTNPGPVGRLKLGDDFIAVLEQLEASLPQTDFLADVMATAHRWYAPGTTFRDSFAGLLRALLPDSGLVLFGSDDLDIKRLAAPLVKREIQDWASSDAVLRAASEGIAKDYYAQVHIRPSNLFLIRDGARLPLDVEGQDFVLRGTAERWTPSGLLELLETAPEQFSPNVVMRPLTQDWLFPTAAYVAGPGETAYFAQYRGVYEWAGIPMPVIYPRISATFIEPGIRRSLDKLGIPEGAFGQDPDQLFARIARERMAFDAEAGFGSVGKALDELVDGLAPEIVSVDGSLEKTVESTRASIHKELDRLKDRVLKADRRNQDQVRQQIQKVAEALYPMGKPQERVINPLYLTAKYGPDFFARLLQTLDTDTRSHLLLDL